MVESQRGVASERSSSSFKDNYDFARGRDHYGRAYDRDDYNCASDCNGIAWNVYISPTIFVIHKG